jgi:hypothetical protein
MTTTVKPITAPVLPDQEELIQRLLSDSPLLADTQDHLVQVVNVLETYGIVLDAYSKNLVDQGEKQLLNPFPFFVFSTRG